MEFFHSFEVNAPLIAVRRFHRDPRQVKQLTPPPIVATIQRAPLEMSSGSSLDFTLWLGPLPIRWRAQFSDIDDDGFTDTQVRGPFRRWVHRHAFRALSDSRTEVRDAISVELSPRPHLWVLGAMMWLGLPLLFRYRAWRTRSALRGETDWAAPRKADPA